MPSSRQPVTTAHALRVLPATIAIAVCLGTALSGQGVAPPGTVAEFPPITAEAANALLNATATPPFLAGTQVDRFVTTEPLLVARTFPFNAGMPARGALGSWLMPVAQLRGKSRAQYLDYWALPIPAGSSLRNNSVAFVRLPAGTHLWSGVAGPIATADGVWGDGGGAQYYVGPQANVPPGSYQTSAQMFFTTPQPLETVQAYGPRLTGATAAVARYLDGLAVRPFSDLDVVLTQLDVLPLIDSADSSLLAGAVRDIGPEQHTATSLVGLRQTAFVLDTFARRGSSASAEKGTGVVSGVVPGMALGNGSRGNDSRPLFADSRPLLVAPRTAAAMSASSGPLGPSGIAGLLSQASAAAIDVGDAQIWFQVGAGFDRQLDQRDLTGFTAQTVSGIGGMDVRLGPSLSIGVGAGVLDTPLTWHDNGGDANVMAGVMAGYAGYHPGGLFVDGAIVGGRNWIATHRRIAIPGVPGLTPDLARTANGRQAAWNFGGQADVGLDIVTSSLLLQPLSGVSYTRFSQQSFNENGADSLDLVVRAYDADSLRLRAGLRMAAAPSGQRPRWRPEGQLVWTHAVAGSAPTLSASLSGEAGSFSFQALGDEPDDLLSSLGLVAQFGRKTIHLRYDGDYSRGRRWHALTVGANLAF